MSSLSPRRFFRFAAFAFLATAPLSTTGLVSVATAQAASAPSATTLSPTLTPAIWDTAIQGARISALCEDNRGRVFAASEENGVWMRGRQGSWTAFTPQNSAIASDMIYALASDQQGRIWAGTARHGVSVFNGRVWKNFDVLQAPVGERIFDIAVSPLDGSVWIASNVGLTRYVVRTDKWQTLYPTAKLPLSHLQTLAFSAKGVLYAGSQSDGLFIARPAKDAKGNIEYSMWRKVVAPATLPDASSGSGLPSNLINDILIARDNTIYVATTSGLAWSRDNGAKWNYKRGRDWVEKARQRLIPAPIKDSPSTENTLGEDYVSSLAEDASGQLWLSHWRQGYEVLDAQTQKVVLNGAPGEKTDDAHSNGEGDYVRCVLPLSNGATFVGRYGKGLTLAPSIIVQAANASNKVATPKAATSSTRSANVSTTSTPVSTSPIATALPSFPASQAAPTLAELNTLLKQLGAVPVAAAKNASPVVALDDDWNTRGDWLGRYGKYWANLCAMISPQDYLWGAAVHSPRHFSRIGPNADKDDAVRYWVHSLQTDNPNSLEIPPVYMHSRVQRGYATWKENRRQSEIDDHGEAYPPEKDGPHLYTVLDIPAGTFILSLYDFNKDGDGGDNRKRDYRVSIRAHTEGTFNDDIRDFPSQPELASSRIRDFRSGVWKRFVVTGPRELTIEVNRNYSHNTILAGMMLDELKEKPAPYFGDVWDEKALDVKRQARAQKRIRETSSTRTNRFAAATTESGAASRLFLELDWLRLTNPTWWAQNSRKYYQPLTLWYAQQTKGTGKSSRQSDAMKQIAASKADTKSPILSARLNSCLWAMRLFEPWEAGQRAMKLTPARDIEKALRFNNEPQDSGKGFQWVRDYVEAQAKAKNSAMGNGVTTNGVTTQAQAQIDAPKAK